jgi:mannose PTS system EIIA component
MLGLVIVGHGSIAQSFLESAEQMMGAQKQCRAVSFSIGDDLEEARERISSAVNEVDTQRGVIILTDMFGGAPSNLSYSVAENRMVEVIAGMNLAMLLKVLSLRELLPMKKVAQEGKQAALQYINTMSELMEAT